MPSFQILGEKNGNNSNINSPTTENTLVIMAHRDYVEQAQAGWQDYRRELEMTDDSDTVWRSGTNAGIQGQCFLAVALRD